MTVEYRSKLTTAEAAVGQIPSGASIAMGMTYVEKLLARACGLDGVAHAPLVAPPGELKLDGKAATANLTVEAGAR